MSKSEFKVHVIGSDPTPVLTTFVVKGTTGMKFHRTVVRVGRGRDEKAKTSSSATLQSVKGPQFQY